MQTGTLPYLRQIALQQKIMALISKLDLERHISNIVTFVEMNHFLLL